MKVTTKVALLGALAASLIAGAGCPESNIVKSGEGLLTIQAQTAPAGAGRYETSFLRVSEVSLRPADPDTAAAFTAPGEPESLELGTMTASVNVDLNAAGATALSQGSVPLAPGTYELSSVTLRSFAAIDTTDPLPPSDVCVEKVADLSVTGGGQGLLGAARVVAGPDPPVILTIPNDGAATLGILVDAAAFVSVAESWFTCTETGFCGSIPAPCLTEFLPNVDIGAAALFHEDLRTQALRFEVSISTSP